MEEKIKITRYTALSLRKSTDDNDSASLQWSMRGIYPRIMVYTSNDKSFKNNKANYDFIITAPFDIVTFQLLLNNFKKLLKAENNTKFTVDCLNNKVVDGKRLDEIYIQAKVVIGKDDTGVMYIAVLEDNKKKIKFTLLPNKYFTFYNNKGEIIKDPSTLSTIYTEAYIATLEKLMLPDLVEGFKSIVEVDKPNVKKESKSKPKEEIKTIDTDALDSDDFDIDNGI